MRSSRRINLGGWHLGWHLNKLSAGFKKKKIWEVGLVRIVGVDASEVGELLSILLASTGNLGLSACSNALLVQKLGTAQTQGVRVQANLEYALKKDDEI